MKETTLLIAQTEDGPRFIDLVAPAGLQTSLHKVINMSLLYFFGQNSW